MVRDTVNVVLQLPLIRYFMKRNLLRPHILFYYITFLLFAFSLQSCATYGTQKGSKLPTDIKDDFSNAKAISHTLYLVGDAGDAKTTEAPALELLAQRLKKADTSSTLIFLGDNIYPRGMPSRGSKNRNEAEEILNTQLAITKNFKGRTLMIPGNHDWKYGIQGIKEQAEFVNTYLKKEAFAPKNACGIYEQNVNEQTAIIVLDTQWFLEDWDDHPNINKDCDIISREQFFDELQNLITKNQNKTTFIAMHHPMLSHGEHGGEFTIARHIFPLHNKVPLPVIGTVMNALRRTSGVFVEDLQNKKYNGMIQRIHALVADKQNIIFISGHDHSLQYIEKDGMRQIISGAGSKNDGARAINDRDFSYGNLGYAKVDVLKNGAAQVSYYAAKDGKELLLFRQQAVYERPKPNLKEYSQKFSPVKDTSIYSSKMTNKSGIYKFLWGNHFRKYYSTNVRAQQVLLDTLYGGLTPTISAGQERARFLRLQHKSGREFEMHALRKSATRFLQTFAFKDQAIERDFRNTYTEDFVLDFYTSAYPYAPFIVAELARNINLNHTNPKLYYIPKQNALESYNEDFGNELYLVEERPTDASAERPRFGRPLKIVTTEDVLAAIRTGNAEVDQREYIKARLFDMLIGDWNRDPKQYSWGEYKEKDMTRYRPIPRNREQAFSKFDGSLLFVIMKLQAIRHMKSFKQNLGNIRWFNRMAYDMDLAFTVGATAEDWAKQAEEIQQALTDSEIERAFKKIPVEVQDDSSEEIKRHLKNRKEKLPKYALQYFKLLQQKVVIIGTDGDETFDIKRNGKKTSVTIYSGDREPRLIEYSKSLTKEIWLYGLGGQDSFNVSGSGKRKILVRLMGGADQDSYEIANGSKVKIYDSKSQQNDLANAGNAKLIVSDSYHLNSYNYEKPEFNAFGSLPNIGFNPDDGVKIGALLNYTVNGFNKEPFTQKHTLNANYFFGTSGYELKYKAQFPHLFGNWDLIADLLYTSPNFSSNFFGYGNETENNDADLGFNYNRVKIRTIEVAPALKWVGESGSSFIIQSMFERKKVAGTADRYITQPATINSDIFDYKEFADLNVNYTFENYDKPSNPTLGMTFSLKGGYKINLAEESRNFPYAESSLGLTYRLSPTANWVLATYLKGRILFDNNYEFYHGATLGGDQNLRGFRTERFIGQQSFFQSTDIRFNLGKLKNGLAPIKYGVFGGYDYGRVWLENEYSDKWHQSVGAGVWLNGLNLLTAKVSVFVSEDGPRLAFGIGFGF